MLTFENGIEKKGAYVVINGVEYEVHMPEYEGNTPLSAENLNLMQRQLLETVFPVGSNYITQTNANPNTILNFGTWERVRGRVLVGIDENDTNLNQFKKIYGEKNHTLTANELAPHNHTFANSVWSQDAGYGTVNSTPPTSSSDANRADTLVNTQYTGGGQAHNNMQPTYVVGYMWIRTA